MFICYLFNLNVTIVLLSEFNFCFLLANFILCIAMDYQAKRLKDKIYVCPVSVGVFTMKWKDYLVQYNRFFFL